MPTIQSVNVTQGVSQSTGKQWTRYDVVLDDGRQASGFAFAKVGDQVNVQQKGQYLNFTPVQNGSGPQITTPQPLFRTPAMSKDDYWQRKEDRDREWQAEQTRNKPRIERQHSQHMMLRYFALRPHLLDKCETAIEAQTLMREVTDHFQRDIGRSPIQTEPVVQSGPEMQDADPYGQHGEVDGPPF